MVRDGAMNSSSLGDGEVRRTEEIIKGRALFSRNVGGSCYRTRQGAGKDEIMKRLCVEVISVKEINIQATTCHRCLWDTSIASIFAHRFLNRLHRHISSYMGSFWV